MQDLKTQIIMSWDGYFPQFLDPKVNNLTTPMEVP